MRNKAPFGFWLAWRRHCPSLCLVLVVLCAANLLPAQSKPERIVSMNLCADHLVMALADRDRIASLSYNSTYPSQSLIADEIGDIPVNHGLAEEIFPLNPDMVISGNYTTPFTDQMLRDRGYRIVEVKLSESIDDVRQNIRRVAEAVGEVPRGEQIISTLDRGLADQMGSQDGPRPTALVLMPGGFTAGRSTIAHELLELAGLENMVAKLGVSGWTNITLEQLLLGQPDIIIFGNEGRQSQSQSTHLLQHPALKDFMSRHESIYVPSRLWGCGTPALPQALEIIVSGVEANRNARDGN